MLSAQGETRSSGVNAATGRSAEDPFGPWPRLVQVPRRRRHWQDKGQAMGSRAVGEEGGRPARAALLGRHHYPHFPDASGQRGALTRARPPDPDHALPTPPCADRTSGALRRSQGAEAGSLGDTGGRDWSRQEAGGGVAWAGALKCACRCAYGHAWEEPGCPGTGGPTTTGGVAPGLCRAGL